MIKNNIVLTVVTSLVLTACATFNEPHFSEQEKDPNDLYPEGKEISKTFILVGDGGIVDMGEMSDGITALKNYVDQREQKGDVTIFLGDNIYPDGMPPAHSENRAVSEHRLMVQREGALGNKGKVIYIPGNHDWYNGRLEGLNRQEEFLKSQVDDDDIFLPSEGCPLVSKEINDKIQLIVIDTQWYLEDWNKSPKINDKCQIKTREKFFIELEGELKKNQQKTVLIAMHHPMFTNGVHGGKFAISKHLFPGQRKIPVPILASLVTQIRTQGGVSKQDRFNEKYNELMRRLKVLIGGDQRIVLASGHEHNLQYIEHEEVKQIVSGSASKLSYAELGGDGLFAYSGQGFAVMDVFEDESIYVRYYGADDNKQPKLLYTHKIFDAREYYDASDIATDYPETIKASVYTFDETEKSDFFETVWGEHYREIYGKKVTAPVALLDTLYGGLKVIRPGGGHQTVSLRLQDKNGKDYNMRALRKNATQFIQKVIFPENEVQEDLENSLPESLVQDFYTAAHPYGAFAVPTLSKAANLMAPTPKLYYVPRQPALGEYNDMYGNQLYMIVERPAEEYDGATFNYPDDIESTDDILDKIRSDEENIVDEVTYIRARMFDMLIGDWDRHNDQWRWAEYKDQNGKDIFVPIPRDRDQVFTNFDGAILDVARGLFGAAKQFAVYDEKLDDIKWFNNAGIKLDRALAQNSTREVWIEQAQFLQDHISDEIIEEAFTNLPPEVRTGSSIDEIKKNLKGRRDNIVEIAEEYWDYFSKLQFANGTDKDDYFEITRGDNQTTVKIWRIKDGEKADVILDRTYYSNETNQLWVYGLDDDDVFEVKGNGNNPIFVRIIGGQNNDIYRISNGRRLKIYDHESLPNTIESRGGANFRLTDVYDYNTYNYQKQILRTNLITPALGFNPDDGIKLGLSDAYTVHGFRQNPFSQQHKFSAGYFFATQGFDFRYSGEFAGIFNNRNLIVSGRFTTPTFSQNFFGYGNESVNPDDELDLDYNRVRMSIMEGSVGLLNNSDYGSTFRTRLIFQGIQVDGNNERYIEENNVINDIRKYFGTAEIAYIYHSADNELAPTRGMDFSLVGGYTYNMRETDRDFGFLNAKMGFYNAISTNRKLVLKTLAQTQIRMGNEYEFYQAATLGQSTGLRGYRFNRFNAKRSFAGSADLRYAFDTFRTGLLPLQIGVFGGYDIGRVFIDDSPSERWHDSYGLGFWVNSADALSGTFNFFNSDEGLRVSFGFGFNF